jgi:hypothetical protein
MEQAFWAALLIKKTSNPGALGVRFAMVGSFIAMLIITLILLMLVGVVANAIFRW